MAGFAYPTPSAESRPWRSAARSGTLQIWRMKPDGTAAEQLTDDENSNSSPHVSPDGNTLAFLSQPRRLQALAIGAASLRVMALHDGLIRTLVEFQGDRGSQCTAGAMQIIWRSSAIRV